MDPDCPVRKKEEHKKRLMENAVMMGKLATTEVHTQQLEEQIQSLMEMSASMAALLSNSYDANRQAFQDKIKELVANFNKHPSSPIDTQAPALRSV